eukprot:12172387-Alexandrium_andersonii.AAC.1
MGFASLAEQPPVEVPDMIAEDLSRVPVFDPQTFEVALRQRVAVASSFDVGMHVAVGFIPDMRQKEMPRGGP